ncbi:hypothetical protein AB0952_33020 [Streptomyces caniferus]|uniref:hypothetical protein n=1 Tax=Streptomyces caniferus TaxID=285557 RepID=UPI003453C4F3
MARGVAGRGAVPYDGDDQGDSCGEGRERRQGGGDPADVHECVREAPLGIGEVEAVAQEQE